MSVPWRKVALFYGLTMLMSHGSVLLFMALGGSFRSPSRVLFAQLASLVPALCAIVLQRWVYREPVRDSLALRARPNRWFLVAWLLPPVIFAGTLGASLVVAGIPYSPTLAGAVERAMLTQDQIGLLIHTSERLGLPPLLLLLLPGLVMGPTICMFAGCGEEIGWRGFLYRELDGLGFWRGTLLTNLLWGLWHVPLIAWGYGYPDHPIAGIFLLLFYMQLLGVVLAYLRARSQSSIAAGLFHASSNAMVLLAVAPVHGGSDLTVGAGSLPFCLVLAVILAALYLYDTRLTDKPLMGAQ